jgi:hypothetical protein
MTSYRISNSMVARISSSLVDRMIEDALADLRSSAVQFARESLNGGGNPGWDPRIVRALGDDESAPIRLFITLTLHQTLPALTALDPSASCTASFQSGDVYSGVFRKLSAHKRSFFRRSRSRSS